MVFAGLFSALVKQEAAAAPSWQLDTSISNDNQAISNGNIMQTDVSDDGNYFIVMDRDVNNTSAIDDVKVFERSNNSWTQKGPTVNVHVDVINWTYSYFSAQINNTGDTFAVAFDELSGSAAAGYVHVYEYNSSTSSWVAKGNHGTAANPEYSDIYPPSGAVTRDWGNCMQLSGDGNRVVCRGNLSNSAVDTYYMFDWNSSTNSWDRVIHYLNGTPYDYMIYDDNGTARKFNFSLIYMHKDGDMIFGTWTPQQNSARVLTWDAVNLNWSLMGGNLHHSSFSSSGSQGRISKNKLVVTLTNGYQTNTAYQYNPRIYEWNATTSSWDERGTNGFTGIPYNRQANWLISHIGALPNTDGTRVVYSNKIYTLSNNTWSEESSTPNSLYVAHYNENVLVLVDESNRSFEMYAYR